MTTFYLIRHGEKDTNDAMVGRMPGVHLTAKGRSQARAIGLHLKKANITRLLSSPLERAVETAQPLADFKRLTWKARLHSTKLIWASGRGSKCGSLPLSRAGNSFAP